MIVYFFVDFLPASRAPLNFRQNLIIAPLAVWFIEDVLHVVFIDCYTAP
ncbi:MAG: hypothetical protein DIU66_008480 [Bacillota bacterium]